jgi:hypothetical protein
MGVLKKIFLVIFIFSHFKSPKSLNETRVKAANFWKHNSNLKQLIALD